MKARLIWVAGVVGLAGCALTGCTLNRVMPRTCITGSLGGKPFTLETPKDNQVEGLDLSCDTNGTVHLTIQKLSSALNPTNVMNAAQGQAALINATADAVARGIQAGAAAAGAAMGAAVKTP